MKKVIELKNVSKVYGTAGTVSVQALKNINLTVFEGGFLAVTGHSGSGKSTLMNIIGLLDKPTSGTYLLDGVQTGKLGEDRLASLRNKKIGFVFQNFNLLARTPAIDNVALPLIYAGVSQKERYRRAGEVLRGLGLSDKLNALPNQLSGGQQQRVAIARALVTNPEIILADEPTGNLDSRSGNEVIGIFENLNRKGKTIIVITHEKAVARYAKKIIIMKDGGLVK